MTKSEMKHTAQMALKSEYGFAPKLNEITLLECNGEGTYILFSVNDVEYRFDSHLIHSKYFNDTVWVGQGTIEKTGFKYGEKRA